jgi:uncharacterized protein YqcC (DUF446 family)
LRVCRKILLHEISLQMMVTGIIADKVAEIKAEMKQTGLWSRQIPAWVNEYAGEAITTEKGFAAWLQFIYLPNLLQKEHRVAAGPAKHIAPQAMQFFGEDVKKGQLLQLLIELDSLL